MLPSSLKTVITSYSIHYTKLYDRSSLKICEQKKIQLILTGTRPAVKSTLEKAGYLDEEHHIILKDNIDLGLAFVQELKSKKETN